MLKRPKHASAASTNEERLRASFRQAWALCQKRDLTKAKAICDEILKSRPDHFDSLHLCGLIAMWTGNREAAVELLGKAISVNPGVAEVHNNRAVALLELRRLDEALASFDKAVSLKSDYAEAFNNRGNVLKILKRLDEALVSYDRAISLKPDYAEAHCSRGNVLLDLKRPGEALASFDNAISHKPDYAQAHGNRGIALQQLERPTEALASYDKAISLRPGYAGTYNNRGNALQDMKRLDEARASFDRAISLKSDYAEAYCGRGNVLLGLKRPDEALVEFDRAISLKSDYAEASCSRGNAFLELKRPDAALASFERAISLKPDYADAYNNKGIALQDMKRLDEALASYDRAISLKPGYAGTHNNRGNVLKDLKRLEEAIASYDKAISLNPDYADAYNNRGNALRDLKRLDAALASYDKAISIQDGFAGAHYNRGVALQDMKRLDEALASFDKALSINPDFEFLFGLYLHTRMKLCDWGGLSEHLRRYEADITAFKRVAYPFPTLSLLDSPEIQKIAAGTFAKAKFPDSRALGPINQRPSGGKIRVGYYSADFRNHPVAYLTAELFEAHNKSQFEVYGFSFGPDQNDEMRSRIASAFDELIDVRGKSDREVALLSRKLGIDIAVDLIGYTENLRTGIFSERCAPIQVNYLGYAGTMAADYIDYIVADKTVIPPQSKSSFTEKIVYLPHSYLVNDSRRKISDRVPARQDLGLPEKAFVFCCFNNNFKILPATFDGWMRILGAVEGSVLWLLEDNPTAAKNLRKEAEARGIDSERIVFAKRIKPAEHLARQRVADLLIDTLPYNAHTTAMDALWVGLPVLTYIGKSFASRVAASLLTAIGLPELIAHSQQEYEARAIELARDRVQLRAIRDRLASNKVTAPLFDAKLFAKHIEAAYQAMHMRHRAGQPPEDIEVQATRLPVLSEPE